MRQALEHTWGKWITGAIFGAIILTFIIFFGPQSRGYAPGSVEWVAKVGDLTVTDREVIASLDRYSRLTGRRQRMDDAAFATARRELTLNMAAVELLAQRAEAAGLAVSDDELRCFIVNWHRGYTLRGERICASFPEDYADRYRNFDIVFFTDAGGKFTDDYSGTVRSTYQVAVDVFEARKRQELLARYYLDLLASTVAVAPGQVQSVYERRNTTVDLEFIRLDPAAASGGDPSSEEIAGYAETHGAEIAAHYADHSADFATPRQIRLRRVYVRKPAADSPEFAAAQAKFQGALERANAGEDFEALARELSEVQAEADAGGDMGMRAQDSIASDLWTASLSLSVGGVTSVEQEYAWNVVKLDEVVESQTRSLEEVSAEIAETLLRAERTAAAAAGLDRRAARVLALAASSSLADAAAAEAAEATAARVSPENPEPTPVAPLAVATTGPFARERPSQFAAMLAAQGASGIEFPPDPADEVPSIGTSRELVATAFGLTEDAPLVPEIVTVGDARFIVRLSARAAAPSPPDAAALAAIETELRDGLVSAVVGDQNQRASLALSFPGPQSPVVASVVDEALHNGKIRLRDDFFVVPASDPVEEL
ncbi:MAG: SurA N-terminal domain-containing protein [Myxococcales bacterium]|nr:SurA N-terminal domain-containing protein [Myxococcales bacterium]MCB9520108.1 SurA N-terminal domain-containing protein [Myxococcales bacterium]MCB9531834.1 SurA N-terminal domain-containing protein [Myxococcales bacterium]